MTPKALLRFIDVDEVFPIRAIFVVNKPNIEANIELVKQRINKILEKCIREAWEEVALAINYYLDWEYYDPSYGICDFYLTTHGLK